MARIQAIGGPADGRWIPGRPGVFIWLDIEGRGSRWPVEGSEMYMKRGRAYWHCEGHWWLCGCGGLVQQSRPHCPLCGDKREARV